MTETNTSAKKIRLVSPPSDFYFAFLDLCHLLDRGDIDTLQSTGWDLGEKIYSFGGKSDMSSHLQMLAQEFSGRSLLLFLHSATIVHIRRKIDIESNVSRFLNLWSNHSEQLLAELDSRWLISACDTFTEFGRDDRDRAYGLAATILGNIIKFYETERIATDSQSRTYRELNGRIEIFDGLSGFVIGGGDAIRNLVSRISNSANPNSPASLILETLTARMMINDSVLKRFENVQTGPAYREFTDLITTGVGVIESQSHQNKVGRSSHSTYQHIDTRVNRIHGDRFSLVRFLPERSVGVELGVATGDFSKGMLDSGKFEMFYGVDSYEDHHDTDEYVRALRHIGIERRYSLLRMRFENALAVFDDESLDFVYIDGYAHTGQESGRTVSSWLRKVKVGGVIAGHDYHPAWPRVMAVVDELARQSEFELMVTELTETPGAQDKFNSWAMIKSRSVDVILNDVFREMSQTAPESRPTAMMPGKQTERKGFLSRFNRFLRGR